jgi:ankyrin repeat protein
MQSALGYGQWAAVRRLWDHGADIGLSHAAVLGLMDMVISLVEASPPPDGDDLSVAFWNACRAGQLAVAQYLLAHGAELDWRAPWDGATPLDAAAAGQQHEMVAWLRGNGARSGNPDQ